MPYASPEQAKLMRAVAHDPSFAQKVGIPQPVGAEFEQASQVAQKADQPVGKKRQLLAQMLMRTK